MVNGPDQIFVEHKGKLTLSTTQFESEEQLRRVIDRIVSTIGRRIDESSPMVDARLKDGSRVNVIIPPLSLNGPILTIRKFSKDPYKITDLIKFGSLTDPMAQFVRACVRSRLNMLVSGGTGSGKTTTLNVLSSFIPEEERVVTVEDAAELQLNQEHVVTLESRPATVEGRGRIAIRDLVVNALRMRPDRIVVGECRGGEALDMLQAMNTGHDGSLTTIHANSPRDSLNRLETLVLMAGAELPSRAIREQISSAINVIVQQSRLRDGSRKIIAVSEVLGLHGDQVKVQDIFVFKQTGVSEDGKVQGFFTATGSIPKHFDHLQSSGECVAKADIKLRVSEYVMLIVGLIVLLCAVLFLRFQNPVLALAGIPAGYFVPGFFLKFRQRRRLKAFNNQLGDTIVLLSNALKAGYSFAQAMATIAKSSSPPMADEFSRAVREMNLGVSVDNALQHMVKRIESEDFDLMVTAVQIHRVVGGNLAEILDTIAFTIRA